MTKIPDNMFIQITFDVSGHSPFSRIKGFNN